MEKKRLIGNPEFWLVMGIIAATAIVDALIFTRSLPTHFALGPIFLHHWLSFTGATFIAVFAPLYYFLKRRYPKSYGALSRIHVFGNLLAFNLISIHFSHHMGRPEETEPEGQTGLALFIAVSVLVATGFLLKFQLLRRYLKSVRFVHTSIITTFYIIVIIHILRGLGYI